MNKEEYNHIRNLSWDLLIDAKINKLPVSITPIAKLYCIEKMIDYNATRYENTLLISKEILSIFGYNTASDYVEMLAIRILSPLIILNKIDIKSHIELSQVADIPIPIAYKRFIRYQQIVERDKFETSGMETKVLNQFNDWIHDYNQSH